MAGISSRALLKTENRFKFNGIEQSNEFDINMYDAHFRNLDPQIGKFWQIDPKLESTEAWSPYAAMLDNPIRYADPLGDSSIPGGYWQGVGSGFTGYFQNIGNKIQSNFEHPGQAIKEALNPANALRSIGHSSVIGQLVDNTRTGISIFNNLAKGNNFEAGQTAGQKTGEGTLNLGVMAVTAGVAKGIQAGSSTTLFRAGSAAELADISQNGLRVKPGGYETGKLFATSAADAAQYGKSNFGLDGIPNTIIQVKVPNSVMSTAGSYEMDGMKAISIPANQLPNVTPVGPLNYSPKPTNPYNNLFGW